MARRGLFGNRPVGAVALVETPVSRSYARKARVAFFTVTVAVGLLAASGLRDRHHPVVALFLGLLVGLVDGFVVALVVRVWPVLRSLWHWALEIAVAATVVLAGTRLASAMDPLVALGVFAALAAVVSAVRPVRRRVVAWVWCVVVRHRLRLCFAEFIRSANRLHPGSLPLILAARPTPAGERVWVWLRPGLALADLDGKAGRMAVACWAGEVRAVRASARYAALIRVDVTRRDPLTGVVGSPLARVIPLQTTPGAPRMTAAVGLDLPDVPEIAVVQPRAGRR